MEKKKNLNSVDINKENQENPLQTKLTKKQEFWNFIKFTLFSISAGVVEVLSFTLLNELIIKDIGQKYGWSYFIALVLSVLWNFTFNKKFTFKSAKNIPVAMTLIFVYYCAFTPLSIWWGNALTGIGWNEYIVLFITMIANMVTEFLWTRYVVYRNSINTAKSKKSQKNHKKMPKFWQNFVNSIKEYEKEVSCKKFLCHKNCKKINKQWL